MTEIFDHFEVNSSPRWPILLRLTGVSLVLHLAALACIVYIPPVREAFNIASLLSETSFVDKPYEKTEIGGDVEIVQLEKFHYPEGYFAIASGLVPQPSPSPRPLPWLARGASPVAPEVAPELPVVTPTPQASPSLAQSSPSPAVQAENAPNAAAQIPSPTPIDADKEKEAADKAQKQLEQTAAANGVDLPVDNEINRQPLKDLASYANDLKQGGKLDLDQTFEVVVAADLDTEAKLQNPVFTQKSGDPNLVDLAGKMIAALNDSKMLVLLKAVNDGKPTKVVFVVRQDQSELTARIESDVSSEESARQKAKVFNLMLVAGEQARKGKDEAVLMRNTSASADGKKVVFTFAMPRQVVGDMIKKQIASTSNPKQG